MFHPTKRESMEMDMEVAPHPVAEELADRMVERDDIMRTLVDETLSSAEEGNIREAGRTKCPNNNTIKGPLARVPRAVDLASCPREMGGTWHTHVTPEEMKNPVNSIPDMANVIYALTDVSVVVGSETADVVVGPDNHEKAQDVFENALGLEASGVEDVTAALENGRLDPMTARQRARRKLDPLIFRVETGYTEFDERIDTMPPENWAAIHGSGMNEEFTGNMTAMTAFEPESFRKAAEAGNGAIGDINIAEIAVSTAIGTIVGNFVDRTLFD